MNGSVERGRVSAIGCFVVALALHAIDATGVVRAQQPQQSIAIQVVQVRPNVWMLAGAGANIVVHLGWMGVVLVDAGSAEMSDQVLTAIQRISDSRIRFIINTGADPEHVGGNAALARAGQTLLRYARLGAALSAGDQSRRGNLREDLQPAARCGPRRG